MDKCVMVFSLLTWESKLLHRGHMLAKYFAMKGYQVYYVQKENVSKVNHLGFSPNIYMDNGIKIVSIPGLPYMKGKSRTIYRINDYILTKQLITLFKEIDNPLILLESPNWIRAVHRSRDRKGILCYDISDDFLEFTTNEKWRNILSYYERETIEKSDYIFITTKELSEKIGKNKDKVFLIENGIDLMQFQDSKNILRDQLKKPVCGFIGGLFKWIDYKLLEKLAIRYPEYNFVLIGPTDQLEEINRLCKNSNIYYLGEKDKNEIGNYFASLDLGLIPFVSEEEYPRLKTVNSNKVFQYSYFGYPVVSTNFSQVNQLKDIMVVCDTQGDFIENVGLALEKDNKDKQEKRKIFAHDNSWERRVEQIIETVDENW